MPGGAWYWSSSKRVPPPGGWQKTQRAETPGRPETVSIHSPVSSASKVIAHPEQPDVEGQALLHVGDDDVDVVDAHGVSLPDYPGRLPR